MKHKCPRCGSEESHALGIDSWGPDDETTYMKCLGCNLLFWYSSFLKKISTNGADAK